MENTLQPVTANINHIRDILSERGLPTKLGTRLNHTEHQLHIVLCKAYDFNKGFAELEIPQHVLHKCGEGIRKIWTIHTKPGATGPKLQAFFTLTSVATKQTVKTALVKDESIFNGKTDQIVLHKTWAQFLQHIAAPESTTKHVDWTQAEKSAKAFHEHTKQAILDGKTFNAHKDNPWARKNLKNKNQQ